MQTNACFNTVIANIYYYYIPEALLNKHVYLQFNILTYQRDGEFLRNPKQIGSKNINASDHECLILLDLTLVTER